MFGHHRHASETPINDGHMKIGRHFEKQDGDHDVTVLAQNWHTHNLHGPESFMPLSQYAYYSHICPAKCPKLWTLGVNGLMQVPYQIFLHDTIKLKAFIVFRLLYILIQRIQRNWTRRMAENGFAPPPPLGNFADISYLVENLKPSLLRHVCTLCSGALVCKSL